MGGGLIQLAAIGAQDKYLTGNPNISFFKCVYKQYTNFCMESIRIEFDGSTEISSSGNQKLSCKLTRNADLISNIYFCFELPEIFCEEGSRKFKWIRNIGVNIIDNVSIIIGGLTIDKHYGEWIYIWKELYLNTERKKNFDNLVGNMVELYNPEEYNGGTYPFCEPSHGLNNNNTIKNVPSIRGKLITTPLVFWFNNDSGLALPLISLQYQDVEIQIELKELVDLYLITDPNTDNYHKPTTSNQDSLGQFLRNQDKDRYFGNQLELQCFLDVNYIFLDTEERKMFASSAHTYLITQVFKTDSLGNISNTNIELELQHPVKEIIWVGQRDDAIRRNDFNNYSNWIYDDIPPYKQKYLEKYDFKEVFFPHVDNNQYLQNHQKLLDFQYLKKDIIFKVDFLMNGLFRFRDKRHKYLNQIQTYQHYKNNIDGGIYAYSFSLNPTEYQPSGSCNMSRLNKINLQFDVEPIPIDEDYLYKYNFNVYTVNYNVLRIMGGLGGLQFSN